MPATIFNLVPFGWTKVASAGQVVNLRNLSDYSVKFKIANLIPSITIRDSVLFVNDSITLTLSEDLYVLGLSGNAASVSVTVLNSSLSVLSISPNTVTVGNVYNGVIFGQTAGSTITATSSDGTTLTVSGSSVSGTFASSGFPTITLVETLAGSIGSPKTSTANITVSAVPVLANLTLSPSTATASTAYSGTISGKTAGSTITATASDGTILSVSGSTVTGTFSAAGSPTVTLIETLAGATGSPKTSTATVTVAAASGGSGGTADFSQASNSNLIAAIAA